MAEIGCEPTARIIKLYFIATKLLPPWGNDLFCG